ncbi:hypothetical protein [Streptomyces sp. ADI95-17]|uniref:hypothetical protein n=1 Tax=Streptomyces sp. ADI95-17 TaxID=1522759 RepID=UPI0013DE6FC6|nr:hypothetical protein [Streptomyces sp. ADI95-17]
MGIAISAKICDSCFTVCPGLRRVVGLLGGRRFQLLQFGDLSEFLSAYLDRLQLRPSLALTCTGTSPCCFAWSDLLRSVDGGPGGQPLRVLFCPAPGFDRLQCTLLAATQCCVGFGSSILGPRQFLGAPRLA